MTRPYDLTDGCWYDPPADDDALPDDGDEFDPADPEQMAYDDAHEESWNGRD